MADIEPAGGDGGAQDLARRVRAARARAGMTRRQLAAASGASERYLANIESGVGNPSLALLGDLARALDLALVELLPRGGERSELHAETAALLRRQPDGRIRQLRDALQRPTVPADARGERIVLIGLRGAGKSSLGTALAERLGFPFVEMSKEIERAYGGEIGLLIELGGQGALRRYEHEAWSAIVAAHEAAVIATPGGIVADAALYSRMLESAHTVWLQASAEDHMQRVLAQGDFRPMANDRGAMGDLRAILEARAPEYARAEARLDTSADTFGATLSRLEQLVAPWVSGTAI